MSMSADATVRYGPALILAAALTAATGRAEPAPQLKVTYYGTYTGPSLSRPFSAGTIDSSSLEYVAESPQNLHNQFKLEYSLTPEIFVGPVLNFYLVPVPDQVRILMNDSGVRIGHRNLLRGLSSNWTWLADLRTMAPLRASYRKHGEWLQLQSLQALTYQPPRSRWTFTLYAFNQYQFFSQPAADTRDWNLYFAPTLSWQFAARVAFSFYWEMYPYHVIGDPTLRLQSDPMDMAPGISWDITDTVSVNPQLVFYPTRLTWSSLHPIVYVSARLY